MLYQARTIFSACTKCFLTQILRTPLPVATQEPGETLGFWHRYMVCPGSLEISCTDGGGFHHCWGSPDDCLGRSSRVEDGASWATELSILHLKGQHTAGDPLFHLAQDYACRSPPTASSVMVCVEASGLFFQLRGQHKHPWILPHWRPRTAFQFFSPPTKILYLNDSLNSVFARSDQLWHQY